MEGNGVVTLTTPSISPQRKIELNGVAAAKPWANLFSTNRLATKGMNLKYTSPVIIDREKIVEILEEDVARDDEKWAPSIVIYVVGTAPSIGAMERFILEQGTFTIKPVILYHKDGYFVVRFANEGERNMVLCSGPQYLMRQPVIMKPWVPDFNFKEEMLTTIPLWVKLPNLPLNCWNEVVLCKIGSILGKPLYADECTSQVNRISFARILVEVDITRPLPKKCLQVGHSCGEKPDVQVLEKRLTQDKKKEWIPVNNRDKKQNNDIGQETVPMKDGMMQKQKEGMQEQGDWQAVRHKSTKRRDKQVDNTNDSGEQNYNEGQQSGEVDGGSRKIGGREYTWTNGHVYSRIDKAIANAAWMDIMPTQVMAREPLFSYHSPLGLIVEDQRDNQKRPFRFYNCLVQHQNFKKGVQAGWQITGGGLKGIWKNLKEVRSEM
ncbi:hypothetical protein RDI58_022406 [Solanum bulbocastanum]|uniref:DUF4283 domain-containing protein n=1 Tax=Solanum bulbocastanum TaxID=147425 RepID=A0AAN8Y5R1_SOLBU